MEEYKSALVGRKVARNACGLCVAALDASAAARRATRFGKHTCSVEGARNGAVGDRAHAYRSPAPRGRARGAWAGVVFVAALVASTVRKASLVDVPSVHDMIADMNTVRHHFF